MRDRIMRALAAIIVAVAGAVAVAAPAHANSIYGCTDNTGPSGLGAVCIYDGTEFGTYWWQIFDLGSIAQYDDQCLQLNAQSINRDSSLVVNPSTLGGQALNGWTVKFWPNDNCTGTPVMWHWADTEFWDNDTRTTPWGNRSNTTNSISVRIG